MTTNVMRGRRSAILEYCEKNTPSAAAPGSSYTHQSSGASASLSSHVRQGMPHHPFYKSTIRIASCFSGCFSISFAESRAEKILSSAAVRRPHERVVGTTVDAPRRPRILFRLGLPCRPCSHCSDVPSPPTPKSRSAARSDIQSVHIST
eukprot:3049964-Prymnesium_polylepis.2